MKLEDLMKQGPMKIRPEGKGSSPRIIAHARTGKGAVVYLDAFWPDAGMPVHKVDGVLEGAGPWRIGPAVIERIDHGDELAGTYNRWFDYLAKDRENLEKRAAEIIDENLIGFGVAP